MLSPQGTQILAALILIGLASALVGWLVLWFRHPHYTPAQRFVYFYGYVLARVLWRAQVSGRLPVAPDQGAVIICNHRGPYDPAFIQLAADRVVHWLVAREYCTHPAMAWFFRIVGSIPVSRAGIDTAATRRAIRHARAGGLVGLLPEGRINETDRLLLPGRPGAAMIALESRVPVIPCYVSGSPNAGSILASMFQPARVQLIIGQPINMAPFYGQGRDRRMLDKLTRLMLAEIAKLAGHPDFTPQLAGRRWKPTAE